MESKGREREREYNLRLEEADCWRRGAHDDDNESIKIAGEAKEWVPTIHTSPNVYRPETMHAYTGTNCNGKMF